MNAFLDDESIQAGKAISAWSIVCFENISLEEISRGLFFSKRFGIAFKQLNVGIELNRR